jgi:Nucleotidyltransferase domain
VSTASPAGHDWAPPAARPMVAAAIAAARADPRIVGLMVGGSAGTGTMDEFSDLDFGVVCRDEHQPELLEEAPAFAAGLGPLLACFTGEHVGQPRLLIALYGPPPLHVDLKFVADRDLDDRVEDRFWVWVHYGATKIGRGELFECLDVVAAFRGMVFGPLVALGRGQRAA